MQTRLIINDVIYGEDKLISVETSSVVMGDECPACGNACASTITVEMLCPAEYIPQNAKMVLQISQDGTNWVNKGVYWIDTRRKDRNARNEAVTMHIEGFDGILKAEQDYQMPEGTWVNLTDAQLLAQVCEDAGIETDWVPDGNYTIGIAPEAFNGRQIIGFIAAMYGGNAVMDGGGKLKLIPLNAGSGTAAVSWAEAMYVGDQMPAITAVLMHDMQGGKYLAEDATNNGVTMNIDCPWATQPMAAAILAGMVGYRYQPFELQSAGLSPSVSIGDTVTFRGITERIYSMTLRYGKEFVATISAPDRNECEHDYQASSSGSGGGGGGAGKKADKEEVRFAMKEYAADIGDVKSGLYAVASADDLKNIKTAQTTLYAKIFDANDHASVKSQLDLKVKRSQQRDATGALVYDKDGNPVYMETADAVLQASTTNSVAKIKLESVTSGGKTKTVADILADAIHLDGKTEVMDNLSVVDGYINAPAVAAGEMFTDYLQINTHSGGLTVGSTEFTPTEVTSIFTVKATGQPLSVALAE